RRAVGIVRDGINTDRAGGAARSDVDRVVISERNVGVIAGAVGLGAGGNAAVVISAESSNRDRGSIAGRHRCVAAENRGWINRRRAEASLIARTFDRDVEVG